MIDRQDVFIRQGEPVFLRDDVKLEVSKETASRPCAMSISAANRTLKIADFTDAQVNRNFELVPTCEVVYWNDMAFIVGLPAIVGVRERELSKIDLFRKATDDSGFYVTEWLETGGYLFCIYEGGIMAFNRHGAMLWHIQKAWDDIFTGIEHGDLILMESDGQIVAIDISNGSRKPIQKNI